VRDISITIQLVLLKCFLCTFGSDNCHYSKTVNKNNEGRFIVVDFTYKLVSPFYFSVLFIHMFKDVYQEDQWLSF
jgi:hypothetical protein